MSNEELKQNLTSTNQWLRLIYMVLFAVLLEIAGFVMLAVVIAQFLFAIVAGSANDNLRRLGDQIASYIYQTLQFLIYNTEEKPFPFAEWPESEEEDLSTYESAEEIDGEVISAEETIVITEDDEDTAESVEPESKAETEAVEEQQKEQKPSKRKSSTKAKKAKAEEEAAIELGADAAESTTAESGSKSSDDKK